MAKAPKLKSKLKSSTQQAPAEKLNLASGSKTYPRSYRWRKHDLDLIDELLNSVKNVSGRHIDATKLIRGALLIASKKSPEKLIEFVAEAEKKSIISKY